MSYYFSEEENKNINNKNDNISEKSFFEKIKIYLNSINDKIIIYRAEPWGVVAILAIIYFIRIFRKRILCFNLLYWYSFLKFFYRVYFSFRWPWRRIRRRKFIFTSKKKWGIQTFSKKSKRIFFLEYDVLDIFILYFFYFFWSF